MSEVRLPFGMRADTGQMVAVDAVLRGLKCDCICPACRNRLIAVQGEIVAHHFRHHVESPACAWARETALHLFAKQIICEDPYSLVLPPPGSEGLGSPLTAEAEVWLYGIKPDVLVTYVREAVAIEIYVAHRVPIEKIKEISERELPTVEIDLSHYRHVDLTEERLREAILRTAGRRWIFEPAHVWQARREAAYAAHAAMLATLREQERQAAEVRDRLQREAAQRKEAWLREEAERQLRRAELEAAQAERDRVFEEERQAAEQAARQKEEWRQAVIAEWRARREPPDLQKLVAAHGGYDKIPPEAHAQWDADMAGWKEFVRAGGLHEDPPL